MIESRFELVDLIDRWGRGSLMDDQGNIVRQWKISGTELALIKSGKIKNPTGCTQEEWMSGKVVFGGQACFDGQGILHPDGSIVICYGIDEYPDKVLVKLLQAFPGEFEIKNNKIHLLPEVVALTEK